MTHAIEVENLTKVYGRPGSSLLAVGHVNQGLMNHAVPGAGYLPPPG